MSLSDVYDVCLQYLDKHLNISGLQVFDSVNDCVDLSEECIYCNNVCENFINKKKNKAKRSNCLTNSSLRIKNTFDSFSKADLHLKLIGINPIYAMTCSVLITGVQITFLIFL